MELDVCGFDDVVKLSESKALWRSKVAQIIFPQSKAFTMASTRIGSADLLYLAIGDKGRKFLQSPPNIDVSLRNIPLHLLQQYQYNKT